MIWLTFAWRNFVRNTRKSYFNLLIILVGTIASIIATGYMNATFMLVKEGTIRGGTAHLQIATEQSFDGYEESPLQHGLSASNITDIREALAQYVNVKLVLPRIKFQGLISNGGTSLVFLGEGISPSQERKLAQNFINTISGKGLEYAPSSDIYNVVIGSEMARLLGANVGDSVTLMSVTEFGGLNAIDATVYGISSSGSPEMDKISLYAPIELAQSLVLTDKVSRIAVQLEDDTNLLTFQKEIANTLPQLTVRNWQELAPFYEQMISLYSRQFAVLGFIIALVVVLTMLNAMLMSLYERKRELATMASMGIDQSAIKRSCVYEGIFIGCLASALGVLLGMVCCELINLMNIDMPPPPGRSQGYKLLVIFDQQATLYICAIAISLCAFSAWLASSRISKMKIVEAINHA